MTRMTRMMRMMMMMKRKQHLLMMIFLSSNNLCDIKYLKLRSQRKSKVATSQYINLQQIPPISSIGKISKNKLHKLEDMCTVKSVNSLHLKISQTYLEFTFVFQLKTSL